jgi:hypothetical protein
VEHTEPRVVQRQHVYTRYKSHEDTDSSQSLFIRKIIGNQVITPVSTRTTTSRLRLRENVEIEHRPFPCRLKKIFC